MKRFSSTLVSIFAHPLILVYGIGVILLPMPTLCAYQENNPHSQQPADFTYNGAAVPDKHFADFFSNLAIGFGEPCMELDLSQCSEKTLKELSEQHEKWNIDCQWRYEGTAWGNLHVVWAYYWETSAMGKFTALMLVKREGDKLIVTDLIYGGDRHSSMLHGCTVEGNRISYSQNVSSMGFMDVITDLYPEFQPHYEKSSKAGLCYGETGYYGGLSYEAKVSQEGKFEGIELISYQRPEGEVDSLAIYPKSKLKEVAMAELLAIDSSVDSEFKENGIAYSPALFQELLASDLENEKFQPKSVSIPKYKDEAAPFFAFTYEYLFKLGKHHLIQAHTWSNVGLYIVQKEGQQLRSIERIAHASGPSYTLSYARSSPEPDLQSQVYLVTYSKYLTPETLVDTLIQCFPELKDDIQHKELGSLNPNLLRDFCAQAKIEASVSSEGLLLSESLIGLNRENRFLYVDEQEKYNQRLQKMTEFTLLDALDLGFLEAQNLPNAYKNPTYSLIEKKNLESFLKKALARATTQKKPE